jgi:polysaccharide export outer membrane protein
VFVRLTPAGFIQLPAIGSVPAQGLTLDEIKREIEARYSRRFHGIEVTPVLDRRAPRYVFVIGEVKNPGRFELEGPTTIMQAIAMAGSWNVGADLRQIVIFRRDECWRLMATKLNLSGTLRCKHPCPSDEIWLRDSDVVLVAKSSLLLTDDFIQLAFTRGLYGVVPFTLNWTNLTAL